MKDLFKLIKKDPSLKQGYILYEYASYLAKFKIELYDGLCIGDEVSYNAEYIFDRESWKRGILFRENKNHLEMISGIDDGFKIKFIDKSKIRNSFILEVDKWKEKNTKF